MAFDVYECGNSYDYGFEGTLTTNGTGSYCDGLGIIHITSMMRWNGFGNDMTRWYVMRL